MNLSSMAYSLYKDEILVEILNHLLTILHNDKILYPKLILNLSTICHSKSDYKKSLSLIDYGIEYSINNNNVNALPKLFFRKFSSELNLEISNYKNSLDKAILMAEINNQSFLKDRFIMSAEKYYGIII